MTLLIESYGLDPDDFYATGLLNSLDGGSAILAYIINAEISPDLAEEVFCKDFERIYDIYKKRNKLKKNSSSKARGK